MQIAMHYYQLSILLVVNNAINRSAKCTTGLRRARIDMMNQIFVLQISILMVCGKYLKCQVKVCANF